MKKIATSFEGSPPHSKTLSFNSGANIFASAFAAVFCKHNKRVPLETPGSLLGIVVCISILLESCPTKKWLNLL